MMHGQKNIKLCKTMFVCMFICMCMCDENRRVDVKKGEIKIMQQYI